MHELLQNSYLPRRKNSMITDIQTSHNQNIEDVLFLLFFFRQMFIWCNHYKKSGTKFEKSYMIYKTEVK